MYRADYDRKARKKLLKLKKKNHKSYNIVEKKIFEILVNPNRFKNLTGNLKRYKRAHVGNSSYVLCFRVDETNKIVVFVWFGHHDDSY